MCHALKDRINAVTTSAVPSQGQQHGVALPLVTNGTLQEQVAVHAMEIRQEQRAIHLATMSVRPTSVPAQDSAGMCYGRDTP